MKLLGTPLELHDVKDTEALCRSVLDRVLRSWGARLRSDDYDDAVTFLIDHAWRLSTRYQQHPTMRFSTYCSRILERRIVDWYRSKFGDSRYRNTRPIVLSLEKLLEDADANAGEIDDTTLPRDAVDCRDDHEDVLFRAAVAG